MEKQDLLKAMIYHKDKIRDLKKTEERVVAELAKQQNDHRLSAVSAGRQLSQLPEILEKIGKHSHLMKTEYLWVDDQLHIVELRIYGGGQGGADIVNDIIIPAEVLNEKPAQ